MISPHAALQSNWAVFKTALDLLHDGALVCDEDATLCTGNDAGLAVLGERDGLMLNDGKVRTHDARVGAQLHAILAGGAAVEGARKPDAANSALLVPRPSGLTSYQIVMRKLPAGASVLEVENSSLWGIMISDPCTSSAHVMGAISMLYHLTPAEARLATACCAARPPRKSPSRPKSKCPPSDRS